MLNARVAEHQLDDPNVHAVGEQAARAFVAQVVPPQVDAAQLVLVLFHPFLAGLQLHAVRQQLQRFPGRLNRRLVGAVRAAEHEGL